jgi:hypothetical protein
MKIVVSEAQFEMIKNKFNSNKNIEELDEDDAAATPAAAATPSDTSSPSAGVSKGYPKVTKWDEVNSPKRGKANPLGKSGEKWSTGLTRGVANNLF